MLDLGISELLLVGVVALIIVGPKDLPKMFRIIGQYVGRAKAMARDFQRSFEDAAKDTGFDDIKKNLNTLQDFSPNKIAKNVVHDTLKSKSSDVENTTGSDIKNKSNTMFKSVPTSADKLTNKDTKKNITPKSKKVS